MLGMMTTMPVILSTNTIGRQLAHQWATAFGYGHIIGQSLCGGTILLHTYIAMQSRSYPAEDKMFYLVGWQLAAAITTLGLIPFTRVFMSPTNNLIFALAADEKADFETVRKLVVKWVRLHLVRCMFPLAGSIMATRIFW